MNLSTVGESVCHGMTWSAGRPQLLLAPTSVGALAYAEIMGRRLGFATAAGRFCTGRYTFTETVRVEPAPCPSRAEAEKGGQCAACSSGDEFRFAHQFHHGGRVPPALAAYMEQPHWLYLATFAHQVTKVGTAAEPRKRSRLDEQGALLGTYLVRCADGRAVRFLEDALTRRLGVAQSVRSSAKLRGLAGLASLEEVAAAHQDTVDRAVAALKDLDVAAEAERWLPPTEGQLLRESPRPGERALYPHDLAAGEHGLTVDSCIGSQVLVRLTDRPDAEHYVADLGVLKGRRITPGPFSSPEAASQISLF